MSILIKGMEMPKNCCQCPVNMEVCKRGYKYFLEHPELYDNRADDCPIVPIPPHGRLIDADKMCADLATVDPGYEIMIDWCIRVTEAQQTIIEREDGHERND